MPESTATNAVCYTTSRDAIQGWQPRADEYAAKRRALDSMASPIDDAVMEFAETWPGDLATSKDLRSFVYQAVGGSFLSDQSLKYAKDRAGMVSPGRVIKVNTIKETVLIVRKWKREDVMNAAPSEMARMILESRAAFRGDGGDD